MGKVKIPGAPVSKPTPTTPSGVNLSQKMNETSVSGRTWRNLKITKDSSPKLGKGYNAFTGQVHGLGVISSETTSHYNEEKTTYEIIRISSYSQLAFELGCQEFPSNWSRTVGNLPGRLEFLRESNFNNLNCFMLIKVERNEVSDRITEYAGNREMSDMIGMEDWDTIIQNYGTEYVHAVHKGGQLYVLIEFCAESGTEYRTINDKIDEVCGCYYSEKEMNNCLKDMTPYNTEKIKFVLNAKNVVEVPVSGGNITDFISRIFPKFVENHYREICIETRPYNTLVNVHAFPEVQCKLEEMYRATCLLNEGHTLLNDLRSVVNHPGHFINPDVEMVRSHISIVENRVKSLKRCLSEFKSSPFSTQLNLDINFDDIPQQNRWTPIPLSVSTHTSNRGHYNGVDNNWNPPREMPSHVEAFHIDFKEVIEGLTLEYQCITERRGETEVCSNHSSEFCGTHGENKKVFGYRVRLTGPKAKNYRVCYQAYTQPEGYTPICSDWEYCCPPSNQGIESINVWIDPMK